MYDGNDPYRGDGYEGDGYAQEPVYADPYQQDTGYDASGSYDANGYDAAGYQRPGYDASGYNAAYEETDAYDPSLESYQKKGYKPPPPAGPEIISTSQAVNLTSALSCMFGLFALFLCFADQRSQAIRRFSIQSVGLLVIQVGVGLACLLLMALLGWVPLLGQILSLILWILFIALLAVSLVLRVRMMFHAYRGEAHELPLIGKTLRRFE